MLARGGTPQALFGMSGIRSIVLLALRLDASTKRGGTIEYSVQRIQESPWLGPTPSISGDRKSCAQSYCSLVRRRPARSSNPECVHKTVHETLVTAGDDGDTGFA